MTDTAINAALRLFDREIDRLNDNIELYRRQGQNRYVENLTSHRDAWVIHRRGLTALAQQPIDRDILATAICKANPCSENRSANQIADLVLANLPVAQPPPDHIEKTAECCRGLAPPSECRCENERRAAGNTIDWKTKSE